MKSILIFLLSSLIARPVFAQDSWKVILNNKTALNATSESEEKNVIKVLPAELKKRKEFVVVYTEAEKKQNWERFIWMVDDNDNQLVQEKGSSFKIKDGKLSSLFGQTRIIKVYTWLLPLDPALKATVRVRRVHLCTLTMQ